MANFTDTELEDAVSALVRSEVKTERTDLGPLNADNTWVEAQELASSTLVFDPSAIFYLLSLAANRVNQDVEDTIEALDDLITAIQEMGRATKKVTRTALLEDAAAAILDAERLLEEKGSLAERPYDRYSKSLQQFEAASLTPNIRKSTGSSYPDTYEIARPPQKAQEAIKTDISSIRDLHDTVLEEAEQLTNSMSEFLSADLPKKAVQQSLSKVRTDIRKVKSELDNATDSEAISMTRDAFLRLRAGEAVTNNLRTISDPREPRMQGTSATTDRARAAYDSSTSSSTPAQVQTSISAPFLIVPSTSDTLKLAVDGGTEQSVTLVPDEPANLIGQNGQNYDFHAAQAASLDSSFSGPYTIPASPDNQFDIYVDGIGYRATLTAGSRTAYQLSEEISAATRIDGESGLLYDVAYAHSVSGLLRITHRTTGDGNILIGDRTTVNTALGFTDDQDTDDDNDTRGVDANNVLSVVVDDEHQESITITPGDRTAANVVEIIQAYGTYLDAEVTTVAKISGSITTVKLKSKNYGGSALRFNAVSAAETECLTILGFTGTEEDRADYFGMDDLEDALAAVSGISTERDEELLGSGTDGEATLSGGSYIFKLPSGSMPSGLTTSDMLVIKSGDNAGYYPITSLTTNFYDEVYVARAFKTTSGDGSQNQVYEFRRDQLVIKSDSVDLTSTLEVKSANANGAVGLTVGKVYGSTTGLEVVDGGKVQSFERNDVRAGDVVQIETTSYIVSSVTGNGYRLEVTPEVSNDLANKTYVIYSAGALAYEEFIEALSDWFDELESSRFENDIGELERKLNPLILNTNPSPSLINDAYNTASSLRSLYTASPGLSEILEDFVVSAVARIDALLNMLQERGLQHAHDLLLLGEFTEFFSLTKDSASYGGNLLEKMRAIAQNDVPESTDPDQDNVDNKLEGSYEETDPDEDFTDQDDESGNYEFDDSPRFDDEDDLVEETL